MREITTRPANGRKRRRASVLRRLPPLPAKSPGRPRDQRYREQYGLVVICPDERAQAALHKAFGLLAACSIRVVVT